MRLILLHHVWSIVFVLALVGPWKRSLADQEVQVDTIGPYCQDIELFGDGDIENITVTGEESCRSFRVTFTNPSYATQMSGMALKFMLELKSFTCPNEEEGEKANETMKKGQNAPEIKLSTPKQGLLKGNWECSEDPNKVMGFTSVTIIKSGNWTPKTIANIKIVVYRDPYAWTYILVKSMVAIMFVMIPAVLLFLLFHRRQQTLRRRAMEEERNHRRYSIAVISSQRHDIPPTYEDVYETKEPPPCFCQAIAVPPQPQPSSPEEAGTCSNCNMAIFKPS